MGPRAPGECPDGLAIDPTGGTFAVFLRPTGIGIYDVSTGGLARLLVGGSTEVHRMTFSPDGRYLVTALEKGKDAAGNGVEVWDLASGAPPRLLLGSGGADRYYDVTFDPTGTKLAAASLEPSRRVRVLDFASGTVLYDLVGHTGAVFRVEFSPDGRELATASLDYTVRTWDARDGAALRTYSQHKDWVTALAYGPDGQLVSGGSDGTARLWNLDVSEIGVQVNSPVRGQTLSPDGRFALESAELDGQRRIDVHTIGSESNPRTVTMATPPIGVTAAMTAPDGDTVLVAVPGRLDRYDPVTGDRVASVAILPDPVSALLPVDGGVGALSAGVVVVIDPGDGRTLHRYRGERPIVAAAPLPGAGLVAVLDDGTTLRWRSPTVAPAAVLSPAASFSPLDVTVTENGRYVAVSDTGGLLHVVDTVTGSAITIRPRVDAVAAALWFLPGTHLLAGGLSDKTLMMWHVGPNLTLVAERTIKARARSFGTTTGRFTIATDSGDIIAITPPAELLANLCSLAGRNLTKREWNSLIGPDLRYVRVCAQFAPGEGVTSYRDANVAALMGNVFD